MRSGAYAASRARGLVAQGFRLFDRHASRERGLFDRTRRKLPPAAGRAIRLRIRGDDLRAAVEAGAQRGRKVGRAGEDEAHGPKRKNRNCRCAGDARHVVATTAPLRGLDRQRSVNRREHVRTAVHAAMTRIKRSACASCRAS
jgi:hypothetical protein